MGKKGTKRKTQWRTLSITECPQQHSKNGVTKKMLRDSDKSNTSTETNVDEAISQDDDCSNRKSYSTSANQLPSYLKRTSNFKSDYRNHHNSSHSYYSKHNSTSSTSSLYSSSRYSYHRRPFTSPQYNNSQTNSSKYSSYGAERTSSRGHRTTSENRDTKPIFNEDEYTRISTPRQDVIFKKGYFSQPKKYMSSTDTNTTSSAAASIVSAEESISALSVPSLSPEQCPSIADSLDPEQGFMYSFIDPNGVVYSYMPNGFDQYGGQMMMMPYGYPPYLCSPDIISPAGSNEESDQNRTSVESNEIPSSDLNETNVINEVPDDASSSSATSKVEVKEENEEKEEKKNESSVVSSTDESDNKECDEIKPSSESDEVIEESKENENNAEIPDNIPGQFYGYGPYQPYYPQIIYPYMFPQQFVPVFGNDCDVPNEECDEDRNRIRYHKSRKKKTTEGNSTGVSATTSDYSEDESDEEDITELQNDTAETVERSKEASQQSSSQINETENKEITLNVNVKEFVPRGTLQSSLNANVKEFLPRHYKNSRQRSNHTVKSLSKVSESTTVITESESNFTPTKTASRLGLDRKEKTDTKPTELTLAEKIKQRLAEESTVNQQKRQIVQRPLPQRKRNNNLMPKNDSSSSRISNPKKRLPQPETRTQPSYAQIANTTKTVSGSSKSPRKEVSPRKEISPQKVVSPPALVADREPKVDQSVSVAEQEAEPVVENIQKTVDTWRTVKPRGKRGKYIKELSQDENFDDWEEPSIQPVDSVKVPVVIEPIVQEEPVKEETAEKSEVVLPVVISDEAVTEKEVTTIAEAEMTEESVIEAPATPKKKTAKSKNRKSTKKPVDMKKKKKIELIDTDFNIPSNTNVPKFEKTSSRVELKSLDDAIDSFDDDNQVTPTTSETDLTFNHLYFGKGFGRSPMDIIKGFDYKYKSKSILKEEEEMVLSVIKSLNNSGVSSPPKVSPATSVIVDEDDEKTIVAECDSKTDAADSGSETDSVSEMSVGMGLDDKGNKGANRNFEDEDRVICSEVAEGNFNLAEEGEVTLEEVAEATVDSDEMPLEESIEEEVLLSDSHLSEMKIGIQTKELAVVEDIASEVNCGFNGESIESIEFQADEITKEEHANGTELMPKPNSDCVIEINEYFSLSIENLSSASSENKSPETNAFAEPVLLNDDDESPKLSTDLEMLMENGLDNDKEYEEADTIAKIILENGVKEYKNDEEATSDESILSDEEINSDLNEKNEKNALHNKPQISAETSPDISECELTPESRRKSLEELNGIRSPFEKSKDTNGSDDYHSCVNILNGLIKNNSPSSVAEPATVAITEGWSLILNKEEHGPNTMEDDGKQLSSAIPTNIDNCETINEIQSQENDLETGCRMSDKRHHQCNGSAVENEIVSQESEEELAKESARILNASISCDHSSGIGSDCEDNQIDFNKFDTQPRLELERLSNEKSSERIAQSGQDTIKSSSLFPINTAKSEAKFAFEAKQMPDNVLPTYSHSNSTICDNQSVSYTSPSTIIGKSSKSSPLRSMADKVEDVVSTTANSSKFPNRTDTTSHDRFPLTYAVKQWLINESKEPTPEPILRAPDDPKLMTFVQQQVLANDENLSGSETESDDDRTNRVNVPENNQTKSKNLQGNPLRVSSSNSTANDSDSDYNSDSNERIRHEDDNTCKRVAEITSDSQMMNHQQDRFDLLEYWDDEFIKNPQRWLTSTSTLTTDISRTTSMGRDSTSSSGTELSSPGPIESYESVYGKTIDYDRLLADNYEFLSNNILSFSQVDKNKAENANVTRNYTEHTKSIDRKNAILLANCKRNFDNDDRNSNPTNPTESATSLHKNNNCNDNCLRPPPKACCLLM